MEILRNRKEFVQFTINLAHEHLFFDEDIFPKEYPCAVLVNGPYMYGSDVSLLFIYRKDVQGLFDITALKSDG